MVVTMAPPYCLKNVAKRGGPSLEPRKESKIYIFSDFQSFGKLYIIKHHHWKFYTTTMHMSVSFLKTFDSIGYTVAVLQTIIIKPLKGVRGQSWQMNGMSMLYCPKSDFAVSFDGCYDDAPLPFQKRADPCSKPWKRR